MRTPVWQCKKIRLKAAEEEGADWATRHGALLSLDACLRCGVRIEGVDVASVLTRALEDESASVRAAAADSCAWLRRMDLLGNVLGNEDSANVRSLIAKAADEKKTHGLEALKSMFAELGGAF